MAARGLKPHLSRTFKLSNDPDFEEKLRDVVGLHLDPPENAAVFSFDEKSPIQALDRTRPGLPMMAEVDNTEQEQSAIHSAPFNKRLSKKIIKLLKRAYPRPVRMPDKIERHRSYHNTLAVMAERGWVNNVSASTMSSGRRTMYRQGRGLVLSDQKYEEVSKVNWNSAASVVAAIAGLVAAVASITAVVLQLSGQ